MNPNNPNKKQPPKPWAKPPGARTNQTGDPDVPAVFVVGDVGAALGAAADTTDGAIGAADAAGGAAGGLLDTVGGVASGAVDVAGGALQAAGEVAGSVAEGAGAAAEGCGGCSLAILVLLTAAAGSAMALFR